MNARKATAHAMMPRAARTRRLRAMDAHEWNLLYPPGTPVRALLPSGERLESHTAGLAETWGERHWIAVLGVHRGYLPLDHVEPLARRTLPADAARTLATPPWLPDMHL
jgi:hypothetical protein